MDFFESRPTRHGITAVPVNSDTVHRYGSSIPTVDIQGQTETKSEKDKVRQRQIQKKTRSDRQIQKKARSDREKVRKREGQTNLRNS